VRRGVRLGLQAAAIALLVALVALFAQSVLQGSATVAAELGDGKRPQAPNFTLPRLNGAGDVSLQSFRGKVVLLNFWATWCHPCQQEIPDLSKAYDKYKSKGVVFLGVLTDTPDSQQLLNFQSDYAMSYPVVRGTSDLNVGFSYPQSLPTTFVFDKTGHRVGHPRIGAISPSDLSAQLDELVAQN